MPTQSSLLFVESPDGPGPDVLTDPNGSQTRPGSFPVAQSSCAEEALLLPGDPGPLCCMFCQQTFTHQEELGPHVLAQHPTTLSGPGVLRVEAELRVPAECSRPEESAVMKDHSCIVCGQVVQDAAELESHMRRHKDYFTYCCSVCGRRFRESWFLKNHMKMHIKPGAKSKAVQEAPYSINGVTVAQAEPVVTTYKMCMVCGFFFPDHDSLAEHSKIHNRENEAGRCEPSCNESQAAFLYCLDLQPVCSGSSPEKVRSSKRIPELDPYNSYQAWQLATRGKVAVGPNHTKDLGQEVSTDNEDCGSDREELSIIWSEGPGDRDAKELRSQQESSAPIRKSLIQKDKDRPTTCGECHRTFRTYHQLVLHSRVHKRDREDSPTSADAKMPKVGSPEPEEGPEEALEENLIPGEDGSDRGKFRSKGCSYCGKFFRSSYYLTVHMRTHTGEKPYKCAYCDYAAAQKTSLKYHLDRRHKDKPYMKIHSIPAPLTPSAVDGNEGEGSSPTGTEHKGSGSRLGEADAPEDGLRSRKPAELLVQVNTKPADVLTGGPPLVHTKDMEGFKAENPEAPLNLSLKLSLSIPADAQTTFALNQMSCSFCAYKTVYPEVLVIHKKLLHKDKSEATKRLASEGNMKSKRHTGCPPALRGKDVTSLPVTERYHPRRTKSPPPQPTRPQESLSGHPPKRSPVRPSSQDVLHEAHLHRQRTDPHPKQESPQNMDPSRKSSTGKKYIIDQTAAVRGATAERSYFPRGILYPDGARMSLSNRFGSLTQMDFGEPPGKRLKFSIRVNRETEPGQLEEGTNRLLCRGVVTGPPQGPSPSTASEAHCSMNNTHPGLVARLDSDWCMMNLLQSCGPGDLASFYHNTPANPSRSALVNPRPETLGRTLLYQPLPGMPTLHKRDPPGLSSVQHYGTPDKKS